MAIIAEGCDPKDFGFPMDKDAYRYMRKDMMGYMQLKHTQHWQTIQKRFAENKTNIRIREADWIFSMPMDVNAFNNLPIKRWNRFKSNLLFTSMKFKFRKILSRI